MNHTVSAPLRLSRRRFITISAVAAAGAVFPLQKASAEPTLHTWRGVALGAKAQINVVHDDASRVQGLFTAIEREIRRLEGIFSLYQANSELSRLNSKGQLFAPSFEMLELLSLSQRLHSVTEGAFDPTVQPLWSYYARHATGNHTGNFEAVFACVGFNGVQIQPDEIRFRKSGMAMTLNGIAQGFITDRITTLLEQEHCADMVVEIGELAARGSASRETSSDEKGWPVTLRPDPSLTDAQAEIHLSNAAVASSARLGTTFDQGGSRSHILDPRTGRPVETGLVGASVVAPSAALADGLSTAALVCSETQLQQALSCLQTARAFVVREDRSTAWLAA
ncbi:FAD:protein FMN transferase [uncultured Roseibium sp.]|uniref:FAD:protein FMN transferase n=1 Tax=uncultured Roseibium sp. TaxID=1936171 RepID=UPI002617CC04|nr:FAD:protein FMN transferase [uncultured Roseibium sp.]